MDVPYFIFSYFPVFLYLKAFPKFEKIFFEVFQICCI